LAIALSISLAASWLGVGYLVQNNDFRGIAAVDHHLTKSQWVGNLTLTEKWRPHIWPVPAAMPLTQAWTLCYEEQFYLVMGLLLVGSPRLLFKSTALLTLATLPFIGQKFATGFFFDGYWLAFAAGVLVYHALNYQSWTMAVSSTVGLAVCAAATTATTSSRLSQSLGIAFAFSVVLLVSKPWDQRIANARITAPLTWCGMMCYSLYLVHWPLTKAISHIMYRDGLRDPQSTILITLPICLLASLVAGQLFFYCIERHFLNASEAGGSLGGRD